MKNRIEITETDAKHYAELHLSMQRGYNFEANKIEEGYESYDYGSLIIPSGLSDEDKFICALIHLHGHDLGLTTKKLIEWFGWTKYKCYKIARNNWNCYTTALVCENGGYGGTGWVLLPDMVDAMREYRRITYPCVNCKKFAKYEHITPSYRNDNLMGCCGYNTQYKVFKDSGCRVGRFEKKGGSHE